MCLMQRAWDLDGFRASRAERGVRIKNSPPSYSGDPDHSSRVNPVGWTGFDLFTTLALTPPRSAIILTNGHFAEHSAKSPTPHFRCETGEASSVSRRCSVDDGPPKGARGRRLSPPTCQADWSEQEHHQENASARASAALQRCERLNTRPCGSMTATLDAIMRLRAYLQSCPIKYLCK